MNTADTPAPPRDSGLGCLGKGCLTIVCLVVLLVMAFVGGGIWALQRVRHNYSSSEPLPMPEVTTTQTVTTTDQASPANGTTPLESNPTPAIATPAAPINPADAQARWKAFERAAKRNQPASIELSAAEINSLIANEPKLSGKAYVTIENNVGHVKVSIPLKDVVLMGGRYLNGEATVRASPDGDPDKAQISNVILGNQAVPEDMLDRRIFGWSSMRDKIQDWLDGENIAVFKIENDRVIAQTR